MRRFLLALALLPLLSTPAGADTDFNNIPGNTAMKTAADVVAYAQPLNANLTTLAGITPTTVGTNLLGLANPSAITFIRINADNTVTARSAANFRGDIGAGIGDLLAANNLSEVTPATARANLGAAATSHTHAAADTTSGVFAIARLATGTPDGTKFVRDDGTLAVPSGSGPPTPTGTGFTHITSGSQDSAAKLVDAADITNATITFGKIQDVSGTNKLLGRRSSGAGSIEEISLGSSLVITSSVIDVEAPGSLIQTSFLVAGTTFTTNVATTHLDVEMVGGGSGGGGTNSVAGQAAAAGGGAGGAYARKYFTVTGSTGYTIAIGGGGAGGNTTPGIGAAGGDTTFTVGGTTVTAKGGGSANAMAAGTAGAFANGGTGQLSTSGDVNGGGAPGQGGTRLSGTVGYSGMGGSSVWGGGGVGLITGGTGNAGIGRGAGGGGALVLNGSTAAAGGAGTAGAILVREYR